MRILFININIEVIWTMYEEFGKGMSRVTETMDNHRRKGVGRSIQMHLAEFCRKKGLIPISGCCYYNHLSKKTMESAGCYSQTRYLDILTE